MQRLASRHNRSEINSNRERIRTPSVEDDRVFPSVVKGQSGTHMYSNRSVSGHNSCNLQYYFHKNLAMLSSNIEETNALKLHSIDQSSIGTNPDEVSPNERRQGAGNNKTSTSCSFSKRNILRKGGLNQGLQQTEQQEIIQSFRIPPRERQSFEATNSTSSSASALSIEARRNFEQLKSLNQFSASKNKFKTPTNNINNTNTQYTRGEETKQHQQSQQQMLILPVKLMTKRLSAKSIRPNGQLNIPFQLRDIDEEKVKEKTFTPFSVERQNNERFLIPKSISESKSSARLGFAKQDQVSFQGKVNEEIYETPQFPDSTTSTDIKVSNDQSLPIMKLKSRNSHSHNNGTTKSFPKTISSRVLSNIQCSMQLRKILHSNDQSDQSNNVFAPMQYRQSQQEEKSNQLIQIQQEQQNQQKFNRQFFQLSNENIQQQTKPCLEQQAQHQEPSKSTQLNHQLLSSPPQLSQQQLLQFLKPLSNISSFSKGLVIQSQELHSARNYDNEHDYSQQQRLIYKKQRNLSAGGPTSSSSTTKKRLLIKTINPFKKIENISTQQQCSQLSEFKQPSSSASKISSSSSAQKERLHQGMINRCQDQQHFFMELQQQQQKQQGYDHNNYLFGQQSNQQLSQLPLNSKVLFKKINNLEPTLSQQQYTPINPLFDVQKTFSNQNRVQSAVEYNGRQSSITNQSNSINSNDQNNTNRLQLQLKQTLSATRKLTENQLLENHCKIQRSTSSEAKQTAGKGENARSDNQEITQECSKQKEKNYYSAPLQIQQINQQKQQEEGVLSQEIRLFYSKRNKENQDTPECSQNHANSEVVGWRDQKQKRTTNYQSAEKMNKQQSSRSSSQLIQNQSVSQLPSFQGVGNSMAELAQDLHDLRLSVQIENIDHHFACLNKNLLNNQQMNNKNLSKYPNQLDNIRYGQEQDHSDDEIPSRFLDQIDSFQLEPENQQINKQVEINNDQAAFKQQQKNDGNKQQIKFELHKDCMFPSNYELDDQQSQQLFQQQSVQQQEMIRGSNLRSSSQLSSEICKNNQDQFSSILKADQFSQILKPDGNQQSFLSDHFLFESINQSQVIEDESENIYFNQKNGQSSNYIKKTTGREITNSTDNNKNYSNTDIIQTSSTQSSNTPKNTIQLIPGELPTKQDNAGMNRMSSQQLQQKIQQLKVSSPISQLNQINNNQSQQLSHGLPLPKSAKIGNQFKTSPFRTSFDGQNFVKPLQQQQQSQLQDNQRFSQIQEQTGVFPKANSRQISFKKLRKSDSGSTISNIIKEIQIS